MFLKRTEEHPIIKWPITASEPRDGGITRKQHFTAHYKVFTADESNDLAAKGDKAFIHAVLVGADELNDADSKEPIQFNDEVRDFMANQVWLKNAIINGYWQMISGLPAKNS